MPATLYPEAVSETEKELALQRVINSKTFARSEQLKSFLRFICEAQRQRPGSVINEYVIGVEVLGRPAGYSPAEDSSVRTRAYELRHKLEHFYSVETPSETIHIVIPKGTYSPQYVRISVPALPPDVVISPEAAVPPSVEGTQPNNTFWSRPRFRSALLCCALVLAGAGFGWILRAPAPNVPAIVRDPVLAEAWGPLASRDASVLLCAATPLALVVGPLDHHVSKSKNYPAPPEAYPLFSQHRLPLNDQQLGLTFSDNMVSVGLLNAALASARTLREFGASYQVLPERVASASTLRNRNALLFGAPVDSEAIARIMQEMPLSVEFEPAEHEFVVKDRVKRTAFVPQKDASEQFTKVYGLITVMRSKDSDGNAIQTVLFAGITSVGMQGAAEFFSSPSAMRKLQAKFRAEGLKTFPAAYQAVVDCSFSNSSLLGYRYESHRIVDREF